MKPLMIIMAFLFNLSINGGNLSSCTDKCDIKISIAKEKIIFKKEDKKVIDVVIRNMGNDTISIPEWFVLGEKEDIDAEIVFEVEKLNSEKMKYAPIVSDMTYDYTYETSHRISLPLAPNQAKVYKEDIGFCNYLEEPGKYRFKLLLRGICKKHEIKLDWIEFEVI